MSLVLVPLKSTYYLITLSELSVIYGPGNWQQVAGYKRGSRLPDVTTFEMYCSGNRGCLTRCDFLLPPGAEQGRGLTH